MAMVEDLANAATCALSYFACALHRADADVLSGDYCTFADVTGGADGVQGYKITRPFTDALGCSSRSFRGSLANVARSAANVTAGTAGLGWRLWLVRRWGCLGGCSLAGLCGNIQTADGEC